MVAYDTKHFAQKETALDALPLRFETTVLSKAVRVVSLAAGDGEAALGQIGEAGGRVE
jgi:nicotinamidase-related amidase